MKDGAVGGVGGWWLDVCMNSLPEDTILGCS